jgi:nitrous oxide reductase accessory protein NosL
MVIAPRRPIVAFVWISFIILALLLLTAPTLWAADTRPAKPGPKDKCPVCGMFVAKYPDFLAVLTFKDGAHAFFDGVKDMMRYYFNLQKYSPSRKRDEIVQIHVTDYYSLSLIDGFKAFYVSGSDIYGPMGRELIPFQEEVDAKEFLKDHKGKAVLRFQDITKDIMKGLD